MPPTLGIRENAAQFSLLVLVNAFVGAMVGMERTILPPIAEQEFGLEAKVAVLSFIIVFGVSKALTNYLAGRWSDAVGRKRVLVTGWLVAVPVPFLLMWAPSWGWVLAANLLLGVSQGLTWSTTVIMKIDLAGPERRGFAMGLNEFAGYFAVAASAVATGWIAARWGLRPEPFYLGVGYVALGLGLSALVVRETRHHVQQEVRLAGALAPHVALTARRFPLDSGSTTCESARFPRFRPCPLPTLWTFDGRSLTPAPGATGRSDRSPRTSASASRPSFGS